MRLFLFSYFFGNSCTLLYKKLKGQKTLKKIRVKFCSLGVTNRIMTSFGGKVILTILKLGLSKSMSLGKKKTC